MRTLNLYVFSLAIEAGAFSLNLLQSNFLFFHLSLLLSLFSSFFFRLYLLREKYKCDVRMAKEITAREDESDDHKKTIARKK